MYGIAGTIDAVTGSGDELAAHLARAAEAMEQLQACHLYLVTRPDDAPDSVLVVEVWDDRDAHAASLDLEVVQQLIADARPVIAGMGERTEFLPVAGLGISPAR